MSKIWEKQGWHVIGLFLYFSAAIFAQRWNGLIEGSLWKIPTRTWYWLTVLIPVIHQIYVLIGWRAELYSKWFTKHFGDRSLAVFAIGFIPLFLGRVISLTFLGIANSNSLLLDPTLRIILTIVFALPSIYLGYSVAKYFGLKRALGADHFFPEYRKLPLVREGIFHYTNNGMYLFGFFSLWALAFGLASKAALVTAALNHAYIWVHYITVEKPDINYIYKQD